MPKIDVDAVPPLTGGDYPPPYQVAARGREVRRLSPASGLTDFEANRVDLGEGDWSSQRHWHEGEDEFLVMIAGRATLVDDDGETVLAAGDCVAFPKGDGNGHHLIGGPGGCRFVVIGLPERLPCHYPDVDLLYDPVGERHLHKDGTPY